MHLDKPKAPDGFALYELPMYSGAMDRLASVRNGNIPVERRHHVMTPMRRSIDLFTPA